MKLLSHSNPDKSVKVKIHDVEGMTKKFAKGETAFGRKRETKEEKEKKGRYWGFVLFLLTIAAAALLRFI